MSLPAFKDIDRKFRELYLSNFPSGILRFKSRLPEANGLVFSLEETYESTEGNILSKVEMEADLSKIEKNLTWIQKWTAYNEISTGFEYAASPQMTTTGEIMIDAYANKPTISLRNHFKLDQLTATADIGFRNSSPEMTLSALKTIEHSFDFQAFGGASITVNKNKPKWISDISYGIQVEKGNLTMSSLVSNNKIFQTNLYLTLANNMKLGVLSGWCRENKKPMFGTVVQKELESGSLLKARIQSCGLLSLSYHFNFFNNIKATLGMSVKTNDINGPGHKIGMEIEI